MIGLAKKKVIQIDITNACFLQCSNCTRFVGHHKKVHFMSVECFKKAIDSLKDYNGMVGIIGGEPTMHPDFAELVDYLVKVRPDFTPPSERYDSFKNFTDFVENRLLAWDGAKKGLWTSLGKGYYKHYELIQDSFPFQCINDHSGAGEHLALLMPRKELGIPDDEWLKLRDNCWLQKKWSASITPKGAFFCEVAGSLDILFDGPGGWPVEENWWKKEPKDFGKQLEWCEKCSACLPAPRSVAASERDIVSPTMGKHLEAIGSPKYKKGKVDVFDMEKYTPAKYKINHRSNPYVPYSNDAARVAPTQGSLVLQKIEAVVVCAGQGDYLSITLPYTKSAVDKVVVVTDEADVVTQNICKEHGVEFVISKFAHSNGEAFAKGKGVNEGIDALKHKDWVLVLDPDVILPKDFNGKIHKFILNPGALYHAHRWSPTRIEDIELFIKQLDGGEDCKVLYDRWSNKSFFDGFLNKNQAVEGKSFGYFELFNLRAKILQGRERIYPEGNGTIAREDDLFKIYLGGRTKFLPRDVINVIHLPQKALRSDKMEQEVSH